MKNKSSGQHGISIKTLLEDRWLYLLWKLMEGHRDHKGEIVPFDMRYLAAPDTSLPSVYLQLVNALKAFDIELSGLAFHKDLFLKYYSEEYEERWNKQPQMKKLMKSGWKGGLFMEGKLMPMAVYEFTDFDTKLSDKDNRKLRAFIDNYIDNFIGSDLRVWRSNTLTFKKHEEFFVDYLQGMVDHYDKTIFIKDIPFREIDGFLFAHIVIAFKRLGFIEFDYLNVCVPENPDSDKEEHYKFSITVTDRFFRHFPTDKGKKDKPVKSLPENDLKPTYSYKDVDIFMDDANPNRLLYVTLKGDRVFDPNIRNIDFKVLIELVKHKGLCLHGIMLEHVYFDFDTTDKGLKELGRAIGRLRKAGFSIGNERSSGYFLE